MSQLQETFPVTSYVVAKKANEGDLVAFERVDRVVSELKPNEVYLKMICSSICHTGKLDVDGVL